MSNSSSFIFDSSISGVYYYKAPEMRLDSIDGSCPSRGHLDRIIPTGSVANPGVLGGFSPNAHSGLSPGGAGVGGGSASGSTCGGSPAGAPRPRFDEDVQLPLIKVVVLGAPGVGKTSLVTRFVNNEFSSAHCLTSEKSEFFPSLILNGSLFELKVIDLPVIPYFPANSLAEWTDFRSFGLRSASAYLLVYDLSLPSTFNFIKNLRDQTSEKPYFYICSRVVGLHQDNFIGTLDKFAGHGCLKRDCHPVKMLESKDMTNVPVIVVANKVDLVATKNYVAPLHPKVSQQHFYIQHLQQQAETGNNLVSGGLTNALSSTLLSVNGTLANGASNIQDAPIRDRKEISHLVRKNWRSSYIECSAKYNWNVMAVFRELAVTLNMIANGQTLGSKNSKKRRCLVF